MKQTDIENRVAYKGRSGNPRRVFFHRWLGPDRVKWKAIGKVPARSHPMGGCGLRNFARWAICEHKPRHAEFTPADAGEDGGGEGGMDITDAQMMAVQGYSADEGGDDG